MSSRLQLDMLNLSLGRRHLVNAYEEKAGIGVIGVSTLDTSGFISGHQERLPAPLVTLSNPCIVLLMQSLAKLGDLHPPMLYFNL